MPSVVRGCDAGLVCFVAACAGGARPRAEGTPAVQASTPSAFQACVRAPVLFGVDATPLADEAAAQREMALRGPSREAGIRSARVYLDTLNDFAIHSQPMRPECYDVIIEDIVLLNDRHCANGGLLEDEDDCATFATIECDVIRLRTHCTIFDPADPDGHARAARIGEDDIALWTRFGEPRARRGLRPFCAMDRILYDATQAFRVAGRPDRASVARAILVAPESRIPIESWITQRLQRDGLPPSAK